MKFKKTVAAISAAALLGSLPVSPTFAATRTGKETYTAEAMYTIKGWSGGDAAAGLDIADKQSGLSTYNQTNTTTGSGHDVNFGFAKFTIPAGTDTSSLTLKLTSSKGQYAKTTSAYAAVADLSTTVVSGQTAAGTIDKLTWANRPTLGNTTAAVSYTTGGSTGSTSEYANADNPLSIPLTDTNGSAIIDYSSAEQTVVLAIYFQSNPARETFSAAEIEYTYEYDDSVMKEIYVSPDGDDAAAGTRTAPLKTIAKAKETVRTVKQNGMTGDIYVYLTDGRYEPSETIAFTPEDSGTDGYTIHYTAAPGAHPIISGGRKLTGSRTRVEGKNYYVTDYTRDRKLRSLIVNGELAAMTSKNIGNLGPYGENEYTVTPSADNASWFWNTESVTRNKGYRLNTTDSALTSETNVRDVEISTQTTWTTAIVCADTITAGESETDVALQMPYGAIAQHQNWGGLKTAANASPTVYNVFGWLNDQQGRFYFDKTNNKLYYYPRSGEDMSTAEVVVPELEKIIDIQGESLSKRVENIEFSGLTFSDTDWNLWEVAGSYGRASIQGSTAAVAMTNGNWHDSVYRAYDVGPAAVTVNSAKNISAKNNVIKNTGNDGLSFINDVTYSSAEGNSIYDNAGSAVVIGHPQHAFIGDKNSEHKGAYSDKEKYDAAVEGSCQYITLKNNYMHDTSRMFLGSAAVMAFIVSNLDMQYNHIENTPYAGLSLGWCWHNMDGRSSGHLDTGNEAYSTTHDNTVTHNTFIDNVMTLGDSGAIYTLGSMQNTSISNNFIKGIGTPGKAAAYHIRGIHVDEGSSGITGENNVIELDPAFACIDCGGWGYKGPNTWRNNYSNSSIYTTITEASGSNTIYEPNLTFENLQLRSDGLWNKEVFDIIRGSGIRSGYYGALASDYAICDALVPTDFLIGGGITLNLGVTPTEAGGEIWLAPSGTAEFSEGATMAKADSTGNITVPSSSDVTEYYLYIVNGSDVSAPSVGKIAARSADNKRIFYADDVDISGIGSGGAKSDVTLGNTQNADEISAIFGITENGAALTGYKHVNAIDNTGGSQWKGYVQKSLEKELAAGKYTLYILCDANPTSGAARKMGLTVNGTYIGESAAVGDSVKYSDSSSAALYIMPISFTLDEACRNINIKVQAPSGSAAPSFIAMALTHAFDITVDEQQRILSGFESGSTYTVSYTDNETVKTETVTAESEAVSIKNEWYGKALTIVKREADTDYIITAPARVDLANVSPAVSGNITAAAWNYTGGDGKYTVGADTSELKDADGNTVYGYSAEITGTATYKTATAAAAPADTQKAAQTSQKSFEGGITLDGGKAVFYIVSSEKLDTAKSSITLK